MVSFIHLCIGMSVFLKAPRIRINQAFFLAIMGLVLWILFSTANVIYWQQFDVRILLARLSYAAGILATGAIATFCIVFSNRETLPRRPLALISLVCTLFLFLALFPGALLREFRMGESGIIAVHGPFRTPFYITEVALFSYGLWHLWKYYRTIPFSEERYRIKLLGAGIFIPAFTSLFVLTVLPYFVKSSPFLSSIGPISTFGFILLAGYATLRQGYFLEVDLASEYAFNSISGGICVTQADGRIIRHNRRLVEMLEYKGELAGRPIDDLIVLLESKMEGETLLLRPWFKEQQPYSIQIALPGLQDMSLELAVSRLSDSGGRPVGNVFVFHDVSERVHAEEKLRASEANYRAIFDTANDAIFVHDIDTGEIIDVNRKMCEMFGYTPDEARRINVETLSAGKPPYTQEDAIRWIGKAAGGEPQLFEWLAKDKGGRLFWVEVNLKRAAIGGTDRMLAIIRDITARKRTEEALRESDKRYRLLAQNVTDMIWTMDIDTLRLTYVSPSVARVRGYSVREAMAQTMEEILTPASFKVAMETLAEELGIEQAKQQPLIRSRTLELEHTCKDGSTVWTEVTVTFLREPDGRPVELLGVTRDITERKRAEAALQESEERYRTLTNSSLTGIYVRENEKLRFANRRLAEMLGYTREELLEIPFLNLVHPEDEEFAREQTRLRASGEQPTRPYQYRIMTKGGDIMWVEAFGTLITYQGRTAVLGNVIDITERKQLEQQLLQAQKMESIGTLAGGIAHDFNNLLGGILGYASLLKAKTAINHPFFNYVNTIERSALRASELTAQLLAFARGGKYDVRPVDLNRIVREILEIIERTFDKSIEIETHLLDQLPTVEADTAQLQQILMNLCVNASDAMPGGGKLIVETNAEMIREDSVKTHAFEKAGSYVTLSVIDTGIGMDKETMQRIFEPFFTSKEKGKGTGLGLSMVYGAVENHGGYVHVYSKPGEGSTFKVYLPASGKPEVNDSYKPELPRGGNELILVVDDEEVIRSLAKDTLEHYGYRVLLAEDGAKAINIYGEHNGGISLVILDMVMPRMGGHETFLKLKEMNPAVKALLSTGYSQNAKAKEILKNGVMGFVQKPYQLDEFLSKVRSVLDATKQA
jgi:PAS domain S-box-containing protein